MSARPVVSVVIPTRNRVQSLHETIRTLRDQTLEASDYEVIVVDDGSTPSVSLPPSVGGAALTLVRLEGVERSAARNAGAQAARGEVLAFVDDDMTVGRDFLRAHLAAHGQWRRALVVGSVRLPGEMLERPFGRFREELERRGVPLKRGVIQSKNFCTAQNMSISRRGFQELRGFDEGLVSAEDQDFALRHSERGGVIVFAPEATAIHRDHYANIRDYCRRMQWGYERLVDFSLRHPTLPETLDRDRINGPVRWARESLRQTFQKLGKAVIALPWTVEGLFVVAGILEHAAPNGRLLDRTYRLLLGAHIFRGYRRGLARAQRVVSSERSMMAADRG